MSSKMKRLTTEEAKAHITQIEEQIEAVKGQLEEIGQEIGEMFLSAINGGPESDEQHTALKQERELKSQLAHLQVGLGAAHMQLKAVEDNEKISLLKQALVDFKAFTQKAITHARNIRESQEQAAQSFTELLKIGTEIKKRIPESSYPETFKFHQTVFTPVMLEETFRQSLMKAARIAGPGTFRSWAYPINDHEAETMLTYEQLIGNQTKYLTRHFEEHLEAMKGKLNENVKTMRKNNHPATKIRD